MKSGLRFSLPIVAALTAQKQPDFSSDEPDFSLGVSGPVGSASL